MAKKERERKQKREGNRLYFFKREISYKLANKKLKQKIFKYPFEKFFRFVFISVFRRSVLPYITHGLSSFRSSDARKFEILEGSNTDITVLTVMIMYHIYFFKSYRYGDDLFHHLKILILSITVYHVLKNNPSKENPFKIWAYSFIGFTTLLTCSVRHALSSGWAFKGKAKKRGVASR
ncbi:unnamed protein product [Rhizophagus irregularis]|nr:unnamed protein product [Rhizophagus irregularis]